MSFDPHYIQIWHFMIAQTLIASVIGNFLFLIFAWIYIYESKSVSKNRFVTIVDMIIESVMQYLSWVWGKNLNKWAVAFVTCIFFYILWHNLIGLLGDMIVLAVPIWHDYFRPAGTDLTFNAVLAIMWVIWAIVYGFIAKWFHHIEHYIPYKWIWIVPKVNSIWTIIWRIWEIILWLLIWFIEFMWEIWRISSLTLRLFANLFVGMILLGLVTQAANAIFGNTPFLIPLTMFAYELIVAGLQAFIFSLLVTVYFKLASDKH